MPQQRGYCARHKNIVTNERICSAMKIKCPQSLVKENNVLLETLACRRKDQQPEKAKIAKMEGTKNRRQLMASIKIECQERLMGQCINRAN
jgi:hypothetical protein